MSGADRVPRGASQPTRAPRDRALVATLLLPGSDSALHADPLAEITGLAEAAGAEVVGGMFQRLPHPNPRAAFGAGKIAELKQQVGAWNANVLVVDFDLSPSQGRNLEKEVGVRVVDRTELILDIFATRAQSRQAKLQVELAQLQYMRTRLRRMWTHLERSEGAIGTRGPGETQLESDRRLIDHKISELKARLAEIERRRQR
jgi:GTP-binding protein HflX